MHGQILRTDGRGGSIRGDDGKLYRFAWRDCRGIGPADVGNGSRCTFNARPGHIHDYANSVRREATPAPAPPRGYIQ